MATKGAGAGAGDCAGAAVKSEIATGAGAGADACAATGAVKEGLRVRRGDAGIPQCIRKKLSSALLVSACVCVSVYVRNTPP